MLLYRFPISGLMLHRHPAWTERIPGYRDDIKYEFYSTKLGKNGICYFLAVGGLSTLSEIWKRFLPMSLDSEAPISPGRLTADYQKDWFSYASSAFECVVSYDRRTSYYTDQIHSPNKVICPIQLNSTCLSDPYQPDYSGPVLNMYTFSGFDIRRNDMPCKQPDGIWLQSAGM